MQLLFQQITIIKIFTVKSSHFKPSFNDPSSGIGFESPTAVKSKMFLYSHLKFKILPFK